jgi:cytochrome c oxidase cbb3-type subunit II
MKLPQFFTAIAACFLVGWGVFVLAPLIKLGGEGPHVDPDDAAIILPHTPSGSAEAGERVYRDQGCVYCHSQVVTAAEFGPDIAKGWGPRATVARDYVLRKEAFPGIRRFGPDLAFAGWDQRPVGGNGADGARTLGYTRERLFRHLFDPRLDNKMSNAPSYRFLFEERKMHVKLAENAIDAAGSLYAPDEGNEIVPKREAVELVDYLLSLNPNYALPEAPLPEPAAPAAATAAK